jgi:copper homeostasis protein
MPAFLTELAIFHPDSVQLAAELGVPRIELCVNYAAGGISPDAATFRQARRQYAGQLFVMVRSRPGDFIYSRHDYTKMRELARFFKNEGADGIVSGFLTPELQIDEALLQEFMNEISPLPFTFHRAFDAIADKSAALEVLIRAGCTRVLSSGGAPTALEGAEVLRSLQEQAAGRIIILPGGGIRSATLPALLQRFPATEIHTAALESGAIGQAIASREEVERVMGGGD